MLGRVEERKQLYIIGNLPEGKIYNDKEASKQLEIMKKKSINSNPPVWEKNFSMSLKICYHNIHSLLAKLDDIKADLVLPFADLIAFGETWIDDDF